MRLLTFSLLLTTALSAYATPLPPDAHVYVEGEASLEVEPDFTRIVVLLEATNEDVEVAKTDVDARTTQLIASARALGINDRDLSSRRLLLAPATRYRDGETRFLGTRVHREIELTLRDLNHYGALIQAIMSASVNQIVDSSFHSNQSDALISDVQAAAVRDARTRAALLAEAAGRSLGEVHSLSEFSLRHDQGWRLHPSRRIGESEDHEGVPLARASSSGVEPFLPGTLTVFARVYVVFLLR